jgi:ribosomal protein L21E
VIEQEYNLTLEASDKTVREYEVGDVVFANQVIIKGWKDEYDAGMYVVASHGQLGVVISCDHPEYVVNFQNFGDASVMAEDINPYLGHVVRR